MEDAGQHTAEGPHRPFSPASLIEQLHGKCGVVLAHSAHADNGSVLGQSYVFATDLDEWHAALANEPHAALIRTASHEYVLAMLNVCQGQYRNGFKGLRLVLELCLQSVLLSAELVARQEWLNGQRHTSWQALTDQENGPLGTRFCRAFFIELLDHVANFRSLACTVYTELSECIHGNVPNHIPLPEALVFSQETFDLWHEKARLVRLIVHFTFALRYLRFVPSDRRAKLETPLIDQLGHIEAIRIEVSSVG